MSDAAISRKAAESLAAKLDALELTDDERGLLDAVFRAAAEAGEVQGFGWTPLELDRNLTNQTDGVGFPALDGASKAPGYFSIAFQVHVRRP